MHVLALLEAILHLKMDIWVQMASKGILKVPTQDSENRDFGASQNHTSAYRLGLKLALRTIWSTLRRSVRL